MKYTRPAVPADMPAIYKLLEEFDDSTPYPEIAPRDKASAFKAFTRLIAGDGMLFISEINGDPVGTAGAVLTSSWRNEHHKLYVELFWWVRPSCRSNGKVGTELFLTLLKTAREQGRDIMMQTTPNLKPEVVGRWYERHGGIPWDRQYLFRCGE
jgi:hypothetical protein